MAKPKKKKANVAVASADEIAVYSFLYLRQNEETKSVKRKEAALKKEMSSKGVLSKEIEKALKELDTSAAERQAEQERRAAYCTAIGMNVQLELFETVVPRRNDVEAEARQRGRTDAILGRSELDTPYAAGTPEGQAWLAGHRDLHDLVEKYRNRFNAVETEDLPEDAEPPRGFSRPQEDTGPQATDALAEAIEKPMKVQTQEEFLAEMAAGEPL